jgi:integrase
MHADGNGLYLHVGPASRSWIFRFQHDGRRRDMGIGPVEIVSLRAARDKAIDLRRGLREGTDPIEQRRKATAARRGTPKSLTFAECAEQYIEKHKSAWKDQRAWPDSMRLYVNQVIGKTPIGEVDTTAVLRVLEPLWQTKTKTAMNVRGRIELILGWATVHKLRSGENPARWRGHLAGVLPAPGKVAKVEHHKALPYAEMPEFMKQLRNRDGFVPAAIEFAILTCARVGEVLGATWQEIDRSNRVWSVPAEHMKGGKEHRVPLSDAALAVLDRMLPYRRNSVDNIFLGARSGRPMTAPALLQGLGYVQPGITVHGFRSTFADWAAETGKDRDLAEMALAHAVGNQVERSYRRTDLIEQRRELATAWAAWCGG